MYFSVKSTELNVFVFGKFSTSRASGTRGKLPPRFFCRIRNKKMFHQNILYDCIFLDTNYKFSKIPTSRRADG